jgi:hypothetical protein
MFCAMRLQNSDLRCITFAKLNLEDEFYCVRNHSQTAAGFLGRIRDASIHQGGALKATIAWSDRR